MKKDYTIKAKMMPKQEYQTQTQKDALRVCDGIADRAFIRDFFARARSDARENSRQNNYTGKNPAKTNNYNSKIRRR